MAPILQIVQRDAALVTLLQQMANAMFNGGIGGNGFKTAKLPEWQRSPSGSTDMTNPAHVTVTANKNAAIEMMPRHLYHGERAPE